MCIRDRSYSTNYQISGRELLTPDEVRMLDNRYAILFIRGELPVMDLSVFAEQMCIRDRGYTLYADAAFPLIKKQAVPVIIISAQLLYCLLYTSSCV